MKEKVIFMPRLAAALRNKGFKIIRVEANPKKPQYDCYIFEDTPQLQAALTELDWGKNK